MQILKQINRVLITLGVSVAVVACGGGGGGTSTSATTQTGQFVDSPVAGLRYSTATQSGTTNVAGEYKFLPNETVTFSIGNVTFPAVPATGTITPLDIFSTSDPADRRVVNLLVLLQSLDEDGNPGNGIKIPAGAAAAAASAINFDVPYASFAANGAVTALIANSGSVTQTPITDVAARAHFNDLLTGANGATKVNVAPRAVAGNAQSVRQGVIVQLNGVNSSDANGDTLTFSWSISNKPAGSNASLISSNTATPSFVPDVAGDYTLSLTVSDGTLTSATSTVTITATAVQAVTQVALAAQGTVPTLSAANCTAVQAGSNAIPAIVGADMQQVSDTLSAVDSKAHAIFKKLPDTFMWWLRGGSGFAVVNMANLTTATHETTHLVHFVHNTKCGAVSGYKYLLDGTVHTTNLVTGATAPYSTVSQYYPLSAGSRYNLYIAATPFPNVNDARILLDELTAYSTAARLSINMMNTPEYGNFTVHQDGDLAGMTDFMLFVQSYIKAARLGDANTYAALQSTNTKTYLQALWSFAESTLELSIPYALSAPTASYVTGKPLYVNSDVLAQIYSAGFLAELDAIGITHKTAAAWTAMARH